MPQVHLTWADEAPEERHESELYPIDSPFLPPEGSLIQLSKKSGEFLFPRTNYFDVEVVGVPTIHADNNGVPAEIWLEVVPVED